MITFGFKSKFGGWLRSIAAIVLGILILFFKVDFFGTLVLILGAFLIAAGLISLVYGIINRQRGNLGLFITSFVVEIVVGILLFCYPHQVAAFMFLMIGIVLMIFGIWEIVVLASIARPSHLGFASFVLPIICVLAGCFIAFTNIAQNILTVIAGIAVLVYGVSEFLATWRMNRAMKAKNLHPVEEEKPEVKDDEKTE